VSQAQPVATTARQDHWQSWAYRHHSATRVMCNPEKLPSSTARCPMVRPVTWVASASVSRTTASAKSVIDPTLSKSVR